MSCARRSASTARKTPSSGPCRAGRGSARYSSRRVLCIDPWALSCKVWAVATRDAMSYDRNVANWATCRRRLSCVPSVQEERDRHAGRAARKVIRVSIGGLVHHRRIRSPGGNQRDCDDQRDACGGDCGLHDFRLGVHGGAPGGVCSGRKCSWVKAARPPSVKGGSRCVRPVCATPPYRKPLPNFASLTGPGADAHALSSVPKQICPLLRGPSPLDLQAAIEHQ